jgi:hypothetical protein
MLVTGDWDHALEAGERAIARGERYAYERLVFRTWMVVLPMLSERRDPSWLPRHERWWTGAISHFPSTPSPYGVVLTAATRLWMARARGEPLDGMIELPEEVPPFSNPHFLAAREIIAEVLIATGDLNRAASLAGQAPESDWTPLMRSSQALIGAWIASATGDLERAADLAASSVEHARAIGASWWMSRALAVSGGQAALPG